MRLYYGIFAILISAGLLAGCEVSTYKLIDKSEVEQRVSQQLAETVGQAPDHVTCPEDLKAVVGTTMRCELTAGQYKYGVNIAVDKADGDNMGFHIKVDDKPSN